MSLLERIIALYKSNHHHHHVYYKLKSICWYMDFSVVCWQSCNQTVTQEGLQHRNDQLQPSVYFRKQRKPLISRTRLACRVASLESSATRAYTDLYCDNSTWMHLCLYVHESVCLRYRLCLGIEMMNVMLTQNTLKNACGWRTVLHLVTMKYL